VDRSKKKANFKKKAEDTIKRLGNMLTFSDHSDDYKSIWNKIPVITPGSNFLFFWDFINFFCIIFTVFFVPIEMSITENFQQIMGDDYTKTIAFCITFFLVDMILRQFTAFYDKGYLVKNLSLIREKYIQEELLIDVLAIIPLFLSIFA
jgi:hypothetical protein